MIPWFTKVILEINSDCNRHCKFCNRHGDNKHRFFDETGKRVKKFMPMEHIESIVRQLVDMRWKGEIAFGHMSEPTLDDRLCKIITLFKHHGFRTFLHTNGDILRKDQNMCNALSKVCDIIRVGIYDIQDEREIVNRQQWWKQRLSPIGATIFSVATVRFQRRFSLDDGTHGVYPSVPCTEPSRCLVIYYDGKVALCCEDINCDFNLGNVFETPIVDIWNSPHRLEIVGKLKEYRANHPICAACPIVL